MKEFFMDASQWSTLDDLYFSFFDAVKAPTWHGKNLDAVRDSIGVGDINGVEVPYCLVLKNYNMIPAHLKEGAGYFVEVVRGLAADGVPVEIRVED